MEEERAQLTAQIGEMESDDFDENFADSGQVAAEQGEHRTLTATLQEQLDEVEHALRKLDNGTYGTCEASGQDIDIDRLTAMPATRFCIEHA